MTAAFTLRARANVAAAPATEVTAAALNTAVVRGTEARAVTECSPRNARVVAGCRARRESRLSQPLPCHPTRGVGKGRVMRDPFHVSRFSSEIYLRAHASLV